MEIFFYKKKTYSLYNGARSRTRTGTAVTPADFESAASTNFAIRAYCHLIITSLL